MGQESFRTPEIGKNGEEETFNAFLDQSVSEEESATEVKSPIIKNEAWYGNSADTYEDNPVSKENPNEATNEITQIEDVSFNSQEDAVNQAYAEGWEHERQLPEVRDYLEEKAEYAEAVRLWDEHIENLMTTGGDVDDPEALERSLNTREAMQRKLIEVSANYPGDSTSLLYRRMTDPLSKEKFISQRTEAMPAMKEGMIPEIERGNKYGKRYQEHYQQQIDNYDKRLATIFSHSKIDWGNDRALGYGNIDQPGTVYANAIHEDGTPLTASQKNKILAHEINHGIIDFQSPLDTREVTSVLDEEVYDAMMVKLQEAGPEGLTKYRSLRNYLGDPAEIVARMSQFKNYFGMSADEKFTKKHLDHIRNKYVADTGLDNSVSELLTCITPKTEAVFIEVINKYPI